MFSMSQAWDKATESNPGIKPMTFHSLVQCSKPWATDSLMASKVIFTALIMACVLHTAGMSNVKFKVSCVINKDMVNFKS